MTVQQAAAQLDPNSLAAEGITRTDALRTDGHAPQQPQQHPMAHTDPELQKWRLPPATLQPHLPGALLDVAASEGAIQHRPDQSAMQQGSALEQQQLAPPEWRHPPASMADQAQGRDAESLGSRPEPNHSFVQQQGHTYF